MTRPVFGVAPLDRRARVRRPDPHQLLLFTAHGHARAHLQVVTGARPVEGPVPVMALAARTEMAA